ncbi:MAG: orotidine-5'-phosphate decarboxylase [Candidatus Aminicenantia bacterium]
MKPGQRIIIALDVKDKEKAISLVKLLSRAEIFKIGYRLFISQGIPILKAIQEFDKKIFLDLKLHDIPNTVAEAVKQAMRHKIFMLTLHSLGGKEMMTKAVEAAREEAEKLSLPQPKLLAVTILTSLKDEELKEIGILNEVKDQVLKLASLAYQAGVDGIVCSPQEISLLRQHLGNEVLIVTPGVRPLWSVAYDQKRVMTPQDAVLKGADYLVIGRPIIASPSPKKAFSKIIDEIKS